MKIKQYKSKKEFKEDLINLSAIEIYEEVLSGRYIKRFPKGFWQKPEALENSKEITKYMIEEKLKWTDEDIKDTLDFNTFINNGLLGMVNTPSLFNGSSYKAINNAYPDKFKPWELKGVSKNYWNKDTAKKATIWLIKKKLKWNDEDIKNKLDFNTFINNGLYGMLHIFNSSTYKAINNAYPDKFKPWELKSVPINYWTLDTGKDATKWLIDEKLKWNEEDIKNKLNVQIFIDNGLRGMLYHTFNGSPYKAINNTYPGKFKKSDFKNSNYYKL